MKKSKAMSWSHAFTDFTTYIPYEESWLCVINIFTLISWSKKAKLIDKSFFPFFSRNIAWGWSISKVSIFIYLSHGFRRLQHFIYIAQNAFLSKTKHNNKKFYTLWDLKLPKKLHKNMLLNLQVTQTWAHLSWTCLNELK